MTEGAQVVERVSRLLKLIAADIVGASTRSLVEGTGLTRPTRCTGC